MAVSAEDDTVAAANFDAAVVSKTKIVTSGDAGGSGQATYNYNAAGGGNGAPTFFDNIFNVSYFYFVP